MTAVTTDLTERLRLAADYIKAHGWTRGAEQGAAGHVDITDAVRLCAPQSGDEYIVRAVLRQRDRAENWNDDEEDGARSEDEVVQFLRTAEITDEDLHSTFGPQWEAVVSLVRQVAQMTPAARAAAWDAAGDATWDAAWDAAGDAAGAVVGDAAGDAAGALVVRDLIGQREFSQDHYDTLMRPLRLAGITVHPDDAAVTA